VTDPVPIHLNPATDLAPRVLLPGDPHRALAVAQSLLEKPLMFNHRRGLWGYTGTAPDGEPLSVQSTGMGGPSTAIVVEELIGLGARDLIRIGTCGALVEGLELGELVAASTAIAADGASRALGAGARPAADPGLTAALVAGGAQRVTAVSTDLFYDPRKRIADSWVLEGASVVEMEAAAIFTLADRHEGVRAACLLAVSDVLDAGRRERIGTEALEEAGPRLGSAAFEALRA
jgi:DeoD family purine-nucleoside phosphorylase